MLAVEDAHWADEATLEELRYLIRRVEHLPLVLTYRDDELAGDRPCGSRSASPRGSGGYGGCVCRR